MTEYYYQIKGKSTIENYTIWGWPPIFSGKVSAKDKQEAKRVIEEEYGKRFPLRVLKKDIDNNEYLLRIEPINEYTSRLFEDRICKSCGTKFRRIDLYNDQNVSYKGVDYCSDSCMEANKVQGVNNWTYTELIFGRRLAVIYKITNKNNGMIYIGKTTQVFTLRWYQHFYQTGDSKFHRAIKESELHDWLFEIVEVIDITQQDKLGDIQVKILERERYWIAHYDSINKGYNTI